MVESNKILVLLADLKSCSRTQNLEWGKRVHAKAVASGHDSSIYVASTLINMYSKCGSMMDARQVFDSLEHPNVVPWNTLILGYAENGYGLAALDLFTRMKPGGPAPDSVTFVAVLKACNSLTVKAYHWAKELHNLVVENSCDSNMYVQTTLIKMYAKCGSMMEARQVLDCMKYPNTVSWNTLILGYAENGQGSTALDLFRRMKSGSLAPDSVSFMAALMACISSTENTELAECRDWGKEIHNLVVENGHASEIHVQSTLIDMYAKCGTMVDAQQVFNNTIRPNLVCWTVLIQGYAVNGEGITALELFIRMRSEGLAPNSVTFIAVVRAITCLAVKGSECEKCRDQGKAVHNLAVEYRCISDIYVQSSLIDMYGKCGSMMDAREVFDSVMQPNVVTWNALILGYAENGQGSTAFELFRRMKIRADSITLVAIVKASISLSMEGGWGWTRCKTIGKKIHSLAVDNGSISDIYLQTTLIDMYAQCGSMVDARQIFDFMKHPDVVSWTALILGYAENGQDPTALDLLTRMIRISHTSVELVAALKACGSIAVRGGACERAECRERGEEIHKLAMKNGCDSDIYLQNTLIDMYSKCHSMVDARVVFDSIKHPDVVSWNALILGYAENGQGLAALEFFKRMKVGGPPPNSVTFSGALRACSLVGALELGRTIHSDLDAEKHHLDNVLVTCLVDFYAKCGNLVEAKTVFELHSERRDVITWNALLAGFSGCGDQESVFELFEGLQDAGFRPDGVILLCILRCCSHAGLVDKGKECFDTMFTKYGIIPAIEHYACMVDGLGRANKLDDALALLQRMPCSPDSVTWTCILGACRKWKNEEVGKLAFWSLINFNDKHWGAYALMEQIYGSRGMLQEQEMVMGMRLEGIKS